MTIINGKESFGKLSDIQADKVEDIYRKGNFYDHKIKKDKKDSFGIGYWLWEDKKRRLCVVLNGLFPIGLFKNVFMKLLDIKKPPDLWTRGDPNVCTTE